MSEPSHAAHAIATPPHGALGQGEYSCGDPCPIPIPSSTCSPAATAISSWRATGPWAKSRPPVPSRGGRARLPHHPARSRASPAHARRLGGPRPGHRRRAAARVPGRHPRGDPAPAGAPAPRGLRAGSPQRQAARLSNRERRAQAGGLGGPSRRRRRSSFAASSSPRFRARAARIARCTRSASGTLTVDMRPHSSRRARVLPPRATDPCGGRRRRTGGPRGRGRRMSTARARARPPGLRRTAPGRERSP
jgi:hypothetical protein